MTPLTASDKPDPDPDAVSQPEGRRVAEVLGNERLTAMAGAVLLVLFAVEIVTVVALRALMPMHFFVGVLLTGPVAVKTASTGWRFLRYYTRSPAYRRKGPPRPLQRTLAPLLVASTLAVIVSGLALAAAGPAPMVLLQVHAISFLVWLATVIVHAAAYLPRVPKSIREDWSHRPSAPVPGRTARVASNGLALAAAGTAAVLLLPTAAPWAGWITQSVSGFGILAVVLIVTAVVVVTVRRLRRRA
ncbi:hypothetical protein [Sinomonas terrae]|uniref:DUF4405 domain-containing protein n=1 Tax=Sinomonas terrae TaxID=2908838 RepID=A0ABS9TZT8_9MICC|nr:hypothetical protein [Sinomonas terrae]MCH6469875.1 hypothetical protein [Sinomonas terrae]